MSNIKDVAKRANVSIATVSNVFNNPNIVKQETLLRVRQAADELGYSTNRLQPEFPNYKDGSVGVLVPDINNPAYSETVKGIEEGLHIGGCTILLYCTGYDEKKTRDIIDELYDKSVDGVIICSPWIIAAAHDGINRIVKQGLPTVGINSTMRIIDRVENDVISGVMQAMKHLIDLGHSRIGFISGDLYNGAIERSACKRFEGYIAALQESGIALTPDIIHSSGTASYELGYQIMSNWIDCAAHMPTAIFAARDDIAAGVMAAADSAGIKIPSALSVVGYANFDYSKFSNPPLTTIKVQAHTIGLRSAELLLKRMTAPDTKREYLEVKASLILRESTAPPPSIGKTE